MRFDVFTIFPEIFTGPLTESVLKRARDRGLISVHLHNIRDYATDHHRSTDDYPYGGGAGMVMKPEPLFAAVEAVFGGDVMAPPHVACSPSTAIAGDTRVVLLTPQGRRFHQSIARELAGCSRLALICGRYEGFDERIRQRLATDELSIGDYVLTGGELPAMVVIDAVARLVPGVLGDAHSAVEESHAAGLLEYPHYTRPVEFRGWRVPDMLLSGNHGAIAQWRRRQALARTLARRPELLDTAELSPNDHTVLAELGWPHAQPPLPKTKRRRRSAAADPSPVISSSEPTNQRDEVDGAAPGVGKSPPTTSEELPA